MFLQLGPELQLNCDFSKIYLIQYQFDAVYSQGLITTYLSFKNFDLLYTLIDYSIGEVKFLED